MIRFIAIAVCSIVFVITCRAQQIEQFTQPTFSHFLFNPAAAGHGGDPEFIFKYRTQWVGAFDGEEPTTQILSFDTRFNNKFKNLGIGAVIFNDVTGPSNRIGIELAYSYKLKLGESGGKLALGFSGTLLNYSINTNELVLTNPDDPALFDPENNRIGADGDAGIYLYDKSYYLGLSAAQLFQNKFVFNTDTAGFIRLARHFYVIAGYVYDLSDKVEFEPSVLVKAVQAAPVQFDINARIIYDKDYWLGINFRPGESLGGYLGFTYNKRWKLGYSYDYTTSSLSAVSNGSHEIMLGFEIPKKKKSKTPKTPNKEGTIITPTNN